MHSHLKYNTIVEYKISPFQKFDSQHVVAKEVKGICIDPHVISSYSPALDKNVVIYKILQTEGVFDEQGNLVTSLRSSNEDVPSSDAVFSYDPSHDLVFNRLLNEPKQLLSGMPSSKEFTVLGVLKSLYNFAFKNGCSVSKTDPSCTAIPSNMEIEIDSQTSWNIVYHDDHLKSFLKDYVYPSTDSLGHSNFEHLLNIYNQQADSHYSTPCYTFYTSDSQQHELFIKHLCQLFKESFPRAKPDSFYKIRPIDTERVEIEFCFANGNVCIRFQTSKSYKPVTISESFVLSISNMILDKHPNLEISPKKVLLRVRHDPEEILLNRLCNRFSLVDKEDKRCTLADLHYSDCAMASTEVEKMLALKVQEQWIDSTQTGQLNLPIRHQYQNFCDFARQQGVVESSTIDCSFYLLNLIVDAIEKHQLSPKEKDPAIARFVYSYCQSLQLHAHLNDTEISLIWGYLNKMKWVCKNYFQDKFLHAAVQSLLVEKIPFSMVTSTLLLSSLRNAPSTLVMRGDLSLFGLKKVASLPLQGCISEAAQTMTEFFALNQDVNCKTLTHLHALLCQLLQGEPAVFAILSHEEMFHLDTLIKTALAHPSKDVCALGMHFAQIFEDDRYASLCSAQLPRLLSDPSSNLYVLNAFYLHLVKSNPSHKTFDVTSSIDWINLLLQFHGKEGKFFDLAIYHLSQQDTTIMNALMNTLSVDYFGKEKMYELLTILLFHLENNKKDIKQFVSCLNSYFCLNQTMYSKILPSKINLLLNRVFAIKNLQTIIGEELASKYRHAMVGYICNEISLTLIEKQQLLCLSVLNSHIKFPTIPQKYFHEFLELLKPYLDANYQIDRLIPGYELWNSFKSRYQIYLVNQSSSQNIVHENDEGKNGNIIEISNPLLEKFSLRSLSERRPKVLVEKIEDSFQCAQDQLHQFGEENFILNGRWVGPTNAVPPLGEPQKERLKALFYPRYRIGSKDNPTKISLDEWYRELGFHNFEINGSGAQWVLGEEFYRTFLTNLGVPVPLVKDDLFHRMRRVPDDFDTPIPTGYQKPGTLAHLIKPIFRSLNTQFKQPIDSDYAKNLCVKYWPAPVGCPLQIAMVAYNLFESKKVKDQIQNEKLKNEDGVFRLEQIHRVSAQRYHLNIADALSLRIRMKENSITCELQSDYPQIELVLWHHICRRLYADHAETVDQRGAMTELALITRGSYPADENFIRKLFSRYRYLDSNFFRTQLRKAVENHCVGGEDAFFAGILNAATFLGGIYPVEAYRDIKYKQTNEKTFLRELFYASRGLADNKIPVIQSILNLWSYLGWDSKVSIYEKKSNQQIEFRCHYEKDFLSLIVKDDLKQALTVLNSHQWNSVEPFFNRWLENKSLGGLPLKSISRNDVDALFANENVIAQKIAFILLLKLCQENVSEISKKEILNRFSIIKGFCSPKENEEIKHILASCFFNKIANSII
jgi:hypothetical protein